MNKYLIEVDDTMNEILNENARSRALSVEEIIQELLRQYLIPAHILQGEAMEEGYTESGEVNLEWANLK